MLYEVSMAAQLAGALILLLWSFGRVSKNAIELCFPGIVAMETDLEGNGILKKEILQKNVEKIFLNVWAFAYIAFGYIASVFTSNDMESKTKKAIVVVFFATLLVAIGYIASRYLSKAWFKNDVKLSSDEMEKLNVLTPIPEKEILEILKQQS